MGTSGWGTEPHSILTSRVSRVGYLSTHLLREHQLRRDISADILPAEDGVQKQEKECEPVPCAQVALSSVLGETCISIDPFAARNTGGWTQMQLT